MILNLQGLRFVGFLLMFLFHTIGHSFEYGGDLGVSFFFVLSAFVLSLNYCKKGAKASKKQEAWRLTTNQLKKLYPLHITMIFAVLLLDVKSGINNDLTTIILHTLLLQSWIPIDSLHLALNANSWFLCNIVVYYALFPYLYSDLRRWHLLVLFAVVAFVASIVPDGMENSVVFLNPTMRLLDFCVGIFAARVYQSDISLDIKERLARKAVYVEFGIVLVLIAMFFVHNNTAERFRCTLLVLPVSAIIVYVFALLDNSKGFLTSVLHTKPLLFLGNISFELYMTHSFVIRIIYSMLTKAGLQECWWLFAGLSLGISIPIAIFVKRFRFSIFVPVAKPFSK